MLGMSVSRISMVYQILDKRLELDISKIETLYSLIVEAIESNTCNLMEIPRLLCSLHLAAYSNHSFICSKIHRVFNCLFRHTESGSAQLEEYILLGESIVHLLKISVIHGVHAIKDCQILLPFSVSACTPSKYKVVVFSIKDLTELQSLWCNVWHLAAADPLVRTSLLPISERCEVVVGEMVALAGRVQCSTSSIQSLCNATVSALRLQSANSPLLCHHQYTQIVIGLVQWVDFAMSFVCRATLDANHVAVDASVELSVDGVLAVVRALTDRDATVSCVPSRVSGQCVQEMQRLLAKFVTGPREVLVQCAAADWLKTFTPATVPSLSVAQHIPVKYAEKLIALHGMVCSVNRCGAELSLKHTLSLCVDPSSLRAASEVVTGAVARMSEPLCRAVLDRLSSAEAEEDPLQRLASPKKARFAEQTTESSVGRERAQPQPNVGIRDPVYVVGDFSFVGKKRSSLSQLCEDAPLLSDVDKLLAKAPRFSGHGNGSVLDAFDEAAETIMLFELAMRCKAAVVGQNGRSTADGDLTLNAFAQQLAAHLRSAAVVQGSGLVGRTGPSSRAGTRSLQQLAHLRIVWLFVCSAHRVAESAALPDSLNIVLRDALDATFDSASLGWLDLSADSSQAVKWRSLEGVAVDLVKGKGVDALVRHNQSYLSAVWLALLSNTTVSAQWGESAAVSGIQIRQAAAPSLKQLHAMLPVRALQIVIFGSVDRILRCSENFPDRCQQSGGVGKVEFQRRFDTTSRPLSALLPLVIDVVTASSEGDLLSVLHTSVSYLLGCLCQDLCDSFVNEWRAVRKVVTDSAALAVTLHHGDERVGVRQPDQSLHRIQLLLTVCRWKDVNGGGGSNGTVAVDDYLPQLTAHVRDCWSADTLSLIRALLRHMRWYVQRATRDNQPTGHGASSEEESHTSDSQQSNSWFTDCELAPTSGPKSEAGRSAAAAKDSNAAKVSPSTDHLLYVELMLHCRVALASLSACGHGACADLAQEVDELALQLASLNLPGFSARVRLGHLLGVMVQDHSHRTAFRAANQHSKVDSTEVFQRTDVVVRAVKLLSLNFHPCLPAVLCAVRGLMRFVHFAVVTQPHHAMWVLSQFFQAWAAVDPEDKITLNLFNEELCCLVAQGQFAHLLTTNARLAVCEIVLPLLYCEDEQAENPLPDYLLFTICKHIDGSKRGQFVPLVCGMLIAELVTAPQDALPSTAAQVMGRLRSKGWLALQLADGEGYLTDGYPLAVYHILTAPGLQGALEKDLHAMLGGRLHLMLEHTARALGLSLSRKHKDGQILQVAQFHLFLLELVWDLGAEDEEVAATALRVLPVFCHLYLHKSWKLTNLAAKSEAVLRAEMRRSVCSVLESQFLFVTFNLLSSNKHAASQNEQVRSLRCLAGLLRLLDPADLSKFLPKVLVEVGIALNNCSSQVRLAAVQVSTELSNRLPSEVLCTNLSSVVVVLFPLLEAASSFSQDASLALSDLRDYGNVAKLTELRQYHAALSRTGMNAHGFSDELRLIGMACFSSQLGKLSNALVREQAVAIIDNLFSTRRAELRQAVQTVAYLPDVPELGEVVALHSQELKALSLEQSLRLLVLMMKHDSPRVRVLALSRLHEVCRDHKRELYTALQSVSPGEGVFFLSDDNVVSLLLQELLQLSTHEADHSVQEICARCLGELGAIDPAKISVKLSRASAAQNANSPSDSLSFLPWSLKDTHVNAFGLHILEHHLVPGLRSAALAESQDKSGFAIQSVLRHLANLSAETELSIEDAMPAALKTALTSRGILDATEAFWSTDYRMRNRFLVRSPPVYFRGMQFTRWISIWTRYLIKQSRGPLKAIFEACRGIVRDRSELCQFLLPHLVVDLLNHHDLSHENVAVAIVREICEVLKDSRDAGTQQISSSHSNAEPTTSERLVYLGENQHNLQYNQMCVQSVFGLLDTLQSWLSASVAQTSGEFAPKAGSGSVVGDKFSVQRTKAVLNSLVQLLPQDLMCSAALNIKAYARALRYSETNARDLHRNGRATLIGDPVAGSAGGVLKLGKPYRDRASGELPVLSSKQLDVLLTIYSRLEDTDSLQGAQSLRQILGCKSTVWNRIVELEHTDDWLGALLEYGLVHNSTSYARSVDKCIVSRSPALSGPSTSGSLVDSAEYVGARPRRPLAYSMRGDSVRSRVGTSAKEEMAMEETGDHLSASTAERDLCLGEIEELERGRLRCLLELGHLEAVVDQTLGIAHRLPELETSLLPLGVEASWRLMRWDDLDGFLSKLDLAEAQAADEQQSSSLSRIVSDADRFQLSIGKLLLSMRKRQEGSFQSDLLQTRIQTMTSLSAASMESYNRAYPLLARLHVLQELETGYAMLTAAAAKGDAESSAAATREALVRDAMWEQRLAYTSSSVSQRTTLLAVRRTILGLCELPHLIAQNWLQLSKAMRQLGKFDSARLAVRYAESSGLNAEEVLLQECRILKDSGQISKALMLLEPVEIDVVAVDRALKGRRDSLPSNLDTEEKRHRLAERIQLATQLMVDSQQKQGSTIVDRYLLVIALDRKWEQAYFDCARYHEFLYLDAKGKEEAGGSGSGSTQASLGKAAAANAAPSEENMSYRHLVQALQMYCSCLKAGSKLAMQVLPRMLTLWLSFTSLQDGADASTALVKTSSTGARKSSASAESKSPLRAAQLRANEVLYTMSPQIHESVWFMCTPQLVSRVGHRNPETLGIITTILQRVLSAYPKQGIWHVAGLVHSMNTDRKKIVRKVLQETYKAIVGSRGEDALMLVDSQKLFQNLVNLAGHQCKEKKLRWDMNPEVTLSRFLVPTQTVLHHCNPLGHIAALSGASSHNQYSDHDLQYIASFVEVVEVAASKAKPKTITLLTTTGKSVRFLCKQEKDGDLRKDARMMEFNSVVNRLLLEDPEGAKRNMRLRTFAVVCLNEECGILEWVNNTDCIRTLINKAHSCWPDLYPNMSYRDIYHDFVAFQTSCDDDLGGMVAGYRNIMTAYAYRPCFHKWFVERFSDPTEWLAARTMFTRSSAVWSGVGHVIGLGDRHTENILLDQTNGECVHVDFDCLFDKGLTLLRPEIVPFRLTPNMVDAMGASGVEGAFRRTLEVCMAVLRDNKDTLLSVLEPFLRDPTVAWNRGGRAQRAVDSESLSRHTAGFQDHENKEARAMLLKISERLSGVYNIQHPGRDKLLRGAIKRGEEAPTRGLGAGRDESLPLSVQGQVQRLIDEATAEENLVQLYIGWQPWV